nr:hypothetical protein [Tanacetum cinerariifolium]
MVPLKIGTGKKRDVSVLTLKFKRRINALFYKKRRKRIGDGASWSIVVMKGEPVDATGSEATTLAFRAMTSGARRATLDGGLCNSSNSEAIAVSSSKYTLIVLMIHLSTVKTLQAHALKQDEELATSAKSSTNMAWNPGSRLLSHERAHNHSQSSILGEPDANKQEKPKEPKHSTDANIEFIGSSIPKTSAKYQRKLIKATSIIRPNFDAPILIPNTIIRKLYYLTAKQIEAHLDKEEKIKKAYKEARLNAINKPEVIKMVREKAKKLGIHLKEAIISNAGNRFKKAQDAEHEVLKRKHTKKVRKSLELKKHKYDNYMWTISNRLKPKKITDIKIHQKTKTVVITVYRGTDGRTFDIHNTYAFGDFEPKYEIFFTDKFGDQAFQRWCDINKVGMKALVSYLVVAFMVQSPENARFSMKLKKLIAEHPDQEKLKSKKVKLEALGYEMD